MCECFLRDLQKQNKNINMLLNLLELRNTLENQTKPTMSLTKGSSCFYNAHYLTFSYTNLKLNNYNHQIESLDWIMILYNVCCQLWEVCCLIFFPYSLLLTQDARYWHLILQQGTGWFLLFWSGCCFTHLVHWSWSQFLPCQCLYIIKSANKIKIS